MHLLPIVTQAFKVWFAGALIFLGRGTDYQLIAGVASIIVYLAVFEWIKPYRDAGDNTLWTVSLLHLFMSLYCGQILSFGRSNGVSESFVAWLLIALTVAFYLTAIGTTVFDIYSFGRRNGIDSVTQVLIGGGGDTNEDDEEEWQADGFGGQDDLDAAETGIGSNQADLKVVQRHSTGNHAKIHPAPTPHQPNLGIEHSDQFAEAPRGGTRPRAAAQASRRGMATGSQANCEAMSAGADAIADDESKSNVNTGGAMPAENQQTPPPLHCTLADTANVEPFVEIAELTSGVAEPADVAGAASPTLSLAKSKKAPENQKRATTHSRRGTKLVIEGEAAGDAAAVMDEAVQLEGPISMSCDSGAGS